MTASTKYEQLISLHIAAAVVPHYDYNFYCVQCIYVCLHVCIYIHTYIHMYVYIYVCVCFSPTSKDKRREKPMIERIVRF